jgi:hypothetical protein
VKIPENALSVELTFLPTDRGGRRSSVNLADGRYQTVIIAGLHDDELSETDAMGKGKHLLFSAGFAHGPESVLPGSSARAVVYALLYPEGLRDILEEKQFTVCEGWKVVGHGRVLGLYREAG